MKQQEQIKKLDYEAPLAVLHALEPNKSLLEHFSFEGDILDDFDFGGSLDDEP